MAQQVYPENLKCIEDAYIDATKQPHSYLLFDMKQSTPEELRIRTCIFLIDNYNYVYIPK